MYLKNIPSLPAAECFAVGAAPSLIFDHGQTVWYFVNKPFGQLSSMPLITLEP